MLRRLKFARKSERWTKEDLSQALLFNEPEISAPEKDQDNAEAKVCVPSYMRKKRGRKKLSSDIPRVQKIHDIEESQKVCSCGNPLTKMGKDSNEKLIFVPARYYIEENIYPKYVCRKCEQSNDGSRKSVISAPKKPTLIPKSFASSGLVCYISISKFVDHLPLYRLERIFKRIGVELTRKIMSRWLILSGRKLRKLVSIMRDDMTKYSHIGIDETTAQVLNEIGRADKQKSFVWAFRGGGKKNPILIFKYHPSRAGSVANAFVKKKFKGTIMSDDFSGYGVFSKREQIIRGSCWAHSRRKFKDSFDIEKSQQAQKVIEMIQPLYAVEKKIKDDDMTLEMIFKIRMEESKPELEKIWSYLNEIKPKTNSSSKLGEAINYTLNNWDMLEKYIEYPEMPIDNNLVENMIRPFAIGRKNWLFMGSPSGALASMAHYSVLQTLAANNLDPYVGLHYIFEKLPYAKTRADYEALAPHRLTAKILEEHAKEMENPPVYIKKDV